MSESKSAPATSSGKTRTFAVYGASDDLVELEIDGKAFDELGEPNELVFSAGTKALHVRVAHDGRRGWTAEVRIEDESEEGDLPFKVTVEQRNYSPLVLVESTGPMTVTWRETNQDGEDVLRTKVLS